MQNLKRKFQIAFLIEGVAQFIPENKMNHCRGESEAIYLFRFIKIEHSAMLKYQKIIQMSGYKVTTTLITLCAICRFLICENRLALICGGPCMFVFNPLYQ